MLNLWFTDGRSLIRKIRIEKFLWITRAPFWATQPNPNHQSLSLTLLSITGDNPFLLVCPWRVPNSITQCVKSGLHFEVFILFIRLLSTIKTFYWIGSYWSFIIDTVSLCKPRLYTSFGQLAKVCHDVVLSFSSVDLIVMFSKSGASVLFLSVSDPNVGVFLKRHT